MRVYEDGYIQVTRDCNQECIFCTQPKHPEFLPLEKIKRKVREYKRQGFTSIVYTGGEPTIYPYILEVIRFVEEQGMEQRMITNGSKLADISFCKRLVKAGLRKVVISVHTHKRELAKRISKTDNLPNTMKGIKNMLEIGCEVNINITIIKLNYPHLSEFVRYLVERFPKIRHFVFNFVEVGGRAAENKGIIPKLSEVELELRKAMQFLIESGRTLRVERVPLCYMGDFEVFSSETRRILGNQEYHTYYISEDKTQINSKELIYDKDYLKSDDCEICWLSPICAGVKNSYKEIHGMDEIYPLFKPVKPFLEMNLSD